jgi:hypothetical protein
VALAYFGDCCCCCCCCLLKSPVKDTTCIWMIYHYSLNDNPCLVETGFLWFSLYSIQFAENSLNWSYIWQFFALLEYLPALFSTFIMHGSASEHRSKSVSPLFPPVQVNFETPTTTPRKIVHWYTFGCIDYLLHSQTDQKFT